MSRVFIRSTLRAANHPYQPKCLPRSSILSLWAVTAAPPTVRSHSSSTHGRSSSVNASEVSHFTELASSWWNPHGPSRLLHLMNPLRHDFIQSCLATETEQQEQKKKHYTFLDIGCGGGIFASSAARLPNTRAVVAIDPTPDVIVVAERHKRSDPLLAETGRLTYLNCAIEDLTAHLGQQWQQSFTERYTPKPTSSGAQVQAQNQGHGGQELEQPQPRTQIGTETPTQTNTVPQFDFVTVFEVVEHIDRPAEFLRTCLTHLRPGGWLIGSTIARHQISYLTTKLIAEAPWPIGVVPQGTHDWNKYINPNELRQWFRKENQLRHTEAQAEAAPASEKSEELGGVFGDVRIEGCVYLPIMGWRFVNGSEDVGNYFFGVQKLR